MELSMGIHYMLETPACRTIFPRVDIMLNNTEYQKSLKFVAPKKNMDRYRAIQDFLLCELFIKHRRACFAFYEDDGPLFMEIIPKAEWPVYEDKIIRCLNTAKSWMEQRRISNWTRLRCESLSLIRDETE